jgi:hypothetical protein
VNILADNFTNRLFSFGSHSHNAFLFYCNLTNRLFSFGSHNASLFYCNFLNDPRCDIWVIHHSPHKPPFQFHVSGWIWFLSSGYTVQHVTKLLDLKERNVSNLFLLDSMALHTAAQHCVNKHSPKQNRTMNNPKHSHAHL